MSFGPSLRESVPASARRTVALAASLAAAVLLADCRGAEARDVDEGRLAGCYALARLDSPRVPLGTLMPDTVMLDSAVQRNDRGEPNPRFPRLLRIVSHRPGAGRTQLDLGEGATAPWPPDWERAFAFTGWGFVRPDSVSANLHQNMGASWNLRFRAVGGSLVGRAEYYDDSPATRSIAIAARRVPCRGGARLTTAQEASTPPAAR